MRSMSKERGTRVKDRAENVATKRGGKGVGKKGRKRLQPGGGGGVGTRYNLGGGGAAQPLIP